MMGREPSASRRGGGRGHPPAAGRYPASESPLSGSIFSVAGDESLRSEARGVGPASPSRGTTDARGRGGGPPRREGKGGTTSYTPHPTRCGGADGSEVSSEMLKKERKCIPKQSLCPLLHRHKERQQYMHSVQL